jgi:hypothetical protein
MLIGRSKMTETASSSTENPNCLIPRTGDFVGPKTLMWQTEYVARKMPSKAVRSAAWGGVMGMVFSRNLIAPAAKRAAEETRTSQWTAIVRTPFQKCKLEIQRANSGKN